MAKLVDVGSIGCYFESLSDPSDDAPRFVPLRVIDASAQAALEVVRERGRVVRVLRGFDANTRRRLLAVLEEERAC